MIVPPYIPPVYLGVSLFFFNEILLLIKKKKTFREDKEWPERWFDKEEILEVVKHMHWDKVSSQIPSLFLSIKVFSEWLKRMCVSIQKSLIWKTIEEHELSMKDSLLSLLGHYSIGCP